MMTAKAALQREGEIADKALRYCACGHPETMHGRCVKEWQFYIGPCFYKITQGGVLAENCLCDEFKLRNSGAK